MIDDLEQGMNAQIFAYLVYLQSLMRLSKESAHHTNGEGLSEDEAQKVMAHILRGRVPSPIQGSETLTADEIEFLRTLRASPHAATLIKAYAAKHGIHIPKNLLAKL